MLDSQQLACQATATNGLRRHHARTYTSTSIDCPLHPRNATLEDQCKGQTCPSSSCVSLAACSARIGVQRSLRSGATQAAPEAAIACAQLPDVGALAYRKLAKTRVMNALPERSLPAPGASALRGRASFCGRGSEQAAMRRRASQLLCQSRWAPGAACVRCFWSFSSCTLGCCAATRHHCA